MFFDEKKYSVLIVSSSDKFNDSIDPLFPRSYYSPVTYANSVGKAQRLLLEQSFDFIVINTPLPDDMGARLAMDVCEKGYSSCLLLLSASLFDEVNSKVSSRGVFTLSKPINQSMFAQAIKWLASARERMRRFEKKETSVEEKIAEIRTISRAKLLLVEKMNLTENEAHKYIERKAMNMCRTKLEVAESVINEYS